ncbi:MAG: hypothetical protein MAG453_00977 [Calditrichaeota bacterium]|nr:hypothetical protein [Calditrichota bacterium]
MRRMKLMIGIALAASIALGFAAEALAQIEMVDERTAVVTSHGVAEGIKKKKEREAIAFERAMDNAVLQLVHNVLREEEERGKFDEIKDEFLVKRDEVILDFYYVNKNNYDKPIYKTSVTVNVRINRDRLQQMLVDWNIIESADDVREQLDRFTIMPYLDKPNADAEAMNYSDLFYTRVRVFFEDRNIPTVGLDEASALEADEQFLSLQKGSAGKEGEEDAILQIARQTPADFFVKITPRIETGSYGGATTKKVILTVGLFSAMTGEFIGSNQGFSEPLAMSSEGASVGAAIDQAMNAAMPRVIDIATSFWRDYMEHGRPIKLIFTDFGFEEIRNVRDALQEMTNDQKRLKAAGNVTEYMVWYDGSPEDLMYKLYDAMRAYNIQLAEDPAIVSNTIRFYRETE